MQPPFASGLLHAFLSAVFLTASPWGRSAAEPASPAMPMPVIEADTANARWLRKPVLAARHLDNMEQTNAWSHQGQGRMDFTAERAHDGQQALRLIAPTKPDRPNTVTGRPFGEAVARREFSGEDWTGFNRLSFWVFPHLPGFKVISMLVKLHNEGATKVPDGYGREGLNYFLLQPDRWNHVVWEIPHLARDRVTAVDFIYRLQGNEPGATNVVCFDLDQLELQRVVCDAFEGWNVAPGRIAYCHSGYSPGARKTALGSGLQAKRFRVVNRETGQTVFSGRLQKRHLGTGEFQVLDFSEVVTPGFYRLEAGAVQTPWFEIGADAWRDSIWKTVNFFFCERCGWAVPGIHDVCHRDWQARNGTHTIVINGGWHDAGDLSQGLVNTAEATDAMLALAEQLLTATTDVTRNPELGTRNSELAGRLVTEARWGLAWMLKTRFGDGSRVTWATMDYWTDGQLGTADDTFGDVRNSPFDNFLAAATEARAARLLPRCAQQLGASSRADTRASSAFPWTASTAEAEAREALRVAREDWQFALEKTSSPNLELSAAGTLASVALFQATGESKYADKACELATVIVASQQRELTDWSVPLAGFFYTGPRHERFLHYAHRGHEQAPIVALAELCRILPEHPDWMTWYSAVALHSEYLQRIAQFTEPWGMLPASVYTVDESRDPRFLEQVRNGIPLSTRHYLRRFPVWFDFRGNLGTVLSQTKALSAAARLRGDSGAAELAQRQLEWATGRNPFCQSLMFGEGHDYAPQYTATSGDIVGSLPVGIQTRENRDLPYWPAANCYNYKEVWVHPSARWLSIMADVFPLAFTGPQTNALGCQIIESSAAVRGDRVTITATVRGMGRHRLALRTSNLAAETPDRALDLKPRRNLKLTWTARVVSRQAPWFAVLVPDGVVTACQEVSSPPVRRDR